MPNLKLAKKIYRLQNGIVRSLNDTHIFIDQAVPLLDGVKAAYESSKSKRDKRYYVPSISSGGYAKRTDLELKAVFDNFLNNGIYESFLVSSVSRFEYFLSDVLREVFIAYPKKLGVALKDIPSCPVVTATEIADAENVNDLLMQVIDAHLTGVFHQRPSTYIVYLCKIVGIEDDPCFEEYYEILATRDLVVHNSLVVNKLYLEKARNKARGKINQKLEVDKIYFENSLAHLKRVSGVIKRDVEKIFGENLEATI